MAQRTRANLISTINALIADNTSKAITPSVLRSLLTDFADSSYNVKSDLQTITTATVTLSSAQILTLFATPVTLVAAQGANQAIVPTSITLKFKYNSIAYATNTNLEFKIGGTVIGGYSSFLAGTSSKYALITGFANSVSTFNTDLQINVATGNPTTGNSTVTIVVQYFVLDMA